MRKVKVLILRTAGTNCDMETAFAFEKAGGKAERVHINELKAKPHLLSNYHLLVLPGGFTYGDDIASGKILANELLVYLGGELNKFLSEGKLILGICNGFQSLVKAGLLPCLSRKFGPIEATLTINDSAKYEDRWVYLKSFPKTSVWTKGLPELIYLPVAHGEGKFIPRDNDILTDLKKKNLIAFQYANEKAESAGYPYNPNGSIEDIAGLTDLTGRILGLMPHPERHIVFTQSPCWTARRYEPHGLAIFKNGVDYARKKL